MSLICFLRLFLSHTHTHHERKREHTQGLSTELSLSQSGQSYQCCVVLKVDHLHVFLSLANLNIQEQAYYKNDNSPKLCEKCRLHKLHIP